MWVDARVADVVAGWQMKSRSLGYGKGHMGMGTKLLPVFDGVGPSRRSTVWRVGSWDKFPLHRYGALSFFLIAICSAQNLSVGFAGGGGLTNAFDTVNTTVPGTPTSYSQSKDYAVGLLLEYRLAGNLSVEGDALYREQHLDIALFEPSRIPNSPSPSPVVTWELPLMAKYRFHWSNVEPFVEAGPAFRPTTNLNAAPSHYGVTAGFGVATRWKQFEIAPMVRYTHWAPDRPLENLAESKSDQVELLIGIASRPRSAWHPLSRRIALGLIGGTTLFHDVPTSSSRSLDSQVPNVSGETYVSGSDTTLLGPALEAALLKHFSLEVDSLYHPIECSRRSVLNNGEVFDSFSGAEGRTFEFPVLAKYTFGAGRLQPFVEAGPSFRLLTENSSLFGISAGAGLEVRVRAVKFSPTLRFTHWGPQGDHSPPTEIIVNQLEFLTSFLL
jgi:hypothetical protein